MGQSDRATYCLKHIVTELITASRVPNRAKHCLRQNVMWQINDGGTLGTREINPGGTM